MSISMRETHLPSCVPPSLPRRLKGFQVPQSEPFSIRAHVLGAAHNASERPRKEETDHKGPLHILASGTNCRRSTLHAAESLNIVQMQTCSKHIYVTTATLQRLPLPARVSAVWHFAIRRGVTMIKRQNSVFNLRGFVKSCQNNNGYFMSNNKLSNT